MRISAKGRYGLAAMVYLVNAQESLKCVTVAKVAEDLGVSKIYLEQVFAMLKKGGLVFSVKGANGGYQLSRSGEKITVYDVVKVIESSLFETGLPMLSEKAAPLESTLNTRVWEELDRTTEVCLTNIRLLDLAQEATKLRAECEFMYYI
ncbi:MAG: hypothetical protein AUK31_02885 [Fibrobacteres bacterium CG2_30_45_31]|nr:MAG: hypothetical protein AUK31_02885 [Fibrobacteres bacterium CG2_30_45_31]